MSVKTEFCEGFFDRALTKEEQASKNRPWGFEAAKQMGFDKFDKTPDGKYVMKIPAGVDSIYDY